MGLIFKTSSMTTSKLAAGLHFPMAAPIWARLPLVGLAVGDGDDTAFLRSLARRGRSAGGRGASARGPRTKASARELFPQGELLLWGLLSCAPLRTARRSRLVARVRSRSMPSTKLSPFATLPLSRCAFRFERTSLPAYLIPRLGHETAVRPR